MPVINKPDLIASVAEETGFSKSDTEKFVNAFQKTIIDSVSEGSKVKLSGFATFESVTRAARTTKNPRTGEDVSVPEKQAVRIRAMKNFRDRVSGERE